MNLDNFCKIDVEYVINNDELYIEFGSSVIIKNIKYDGNDPVIFFTGKNGKHNSTNMKQWQEWIMNEYLFELFPGVLAY